MKQLIKALQKAHAGEWAAFHAYEGHWKSCQNLEDRIKIVKIREEELSHIIVTRRFLEILGANPKPLRTLFFITLGKTLSALCHISGYRFPMLGARVMETIGVANYKEMALMAAEEGFTLMSVKFLHMAAQEKEHERWFQERLDANRRAS